MQNNFSIPPFLFYLVSINIFPFWLTVPISQLQAHWIWWRHILRHP